MPSWSVQLFTIIAVVAGAFASFISTRFIDRSRWQREEALRWDQKRLDCYSDFASSLKHFITTAQHISAGLGLPDTAQGITQEAGLPALASAEQDLSIKWEQVLMLGSPAVIASGREWRYTAFHLEWFARGLRNDPAEYEAAQAELRIVRKKFYDAVREELGIVTGDIPISNWPPAWQAESKR